MRVPAPFRRVASRLLRRPFGSHWGHFGSREEALANLPAGKRGSYDNSDVVPVNLEQFLEIQSFDWPVLFHLQGMLASGELKVVTDFGGHIGVKYYAFRNALNFPDDLVWQVVDVPAMTAEGRRRAANTTVLRFFENLDATAPCDVLLCSGVLPYVDLRIDKLVEKQPSRPQTILLNKVALSNEGPFYTLEDFGQFRLPFRVIVQDELDRARERLGYRLAHRWGIPHRDFIVRSNDRDRQVRMTGEAWILGR